MSIDNRPRTRVARSGRARLSALLHGPDLRIAVAILLVCAALFAITTTFDTVPEFLNQNIPATWFPRVLIVTIVVLTLILPVEHLFLEAGKDSLDEERKARIEPISMLTAVLLAIVVLGVYLLGTFAAMVLVSLLLPLLWGERISLKLVLFVVVFPAVVTFVFTQVLKVYFDPGLLGALFR